MSSTSPDKQPKKWRVLLADICDELSQKNLDRMKFLCGDHLPESSLEKCIHGIDVVKLLMENALICEKNSSHLIHLLKDIGRTDLSVALQSAYPAVEVELRVKDNEQGTSRELLHSLSSPGIASKKASEVSKLTRSHNSLPGNVGHSQQGMMANLKLASNNYDDMSQLSTQEKTVIATAPDETQLKHLETKRVQPEDDLVADSGSPQHTPLTSGLSQDASPQVFSNCPVGLKGTSSCRDDFTGEQLLVVETPLVNPVSSDDTTSPVGLYHYQEELAKPAMEGNNSIICAPTGSGKTLTAAHICRLVFDNCRRKNKQFKGLFIVPIRTLVEQQCNEFRKVFPDDPEVIRKISDTERLGHVIKNNNKILLFLTAQILVNALKEGEVSIRAFSILVMDECHHTTLEHPFRQIMKNYLKEKEVNEVGLPQIVGLTASLGVGKKEPVDHYIHLCANLDCTLISHVKLNLQELLQYNPRPKSDQIISVAPRVLSTFQTVLEALMKGVEDSKPEYLSGPPPRGTQHYENFIVMRKESAEKQSGMAEVVAACDFLRALNDSLLIYEDFRAKDALTYIAKKLPKEGLSDYENWLCQVFKEKQSDLEAIAPVDNNSMLTELHSLLEKLLGCKDQVAEPPKGLLLTRRRVGVEYLHDFLTQQFDGRYAVDCMTGQAKAEGMTDARQNEIIRRFRSKDGINLLIATDVAQEGLDIPRCNFVVRYNFVSSEIGSVQSKGRARARESECYLIVRRGSIDERREYENMAKEHKMQEALLEIDKLDPEVLKEKILEEQKVLMQKIAWSARPKVFIKPNGNNIEIVCRKCKAFLCFVSGIRKKGGDYLCIDEQFTTKVHQRNLPLEKQQHFRLDSNVGSTYCGQCQSPIGPIKKYKESLRVTGYLLVKKNIMYKDGPSFGLIKKWDTVPFEVLEERVFE